METKTKRLKPYGRVKSDTYKNVYFAKPTKTRANGFAGSWYWAVNREGIRYTRGGYKTSRSAALGLDKALLEKGYEPINILKRKQ